MADHPRPAKRVKTSERSSNACLPDISGETVAVRIGDEVSGETFHIHKNVLQRSSPFFRSALEPEWCGSTAFRKPIELLDDKPVAFKIYVQWLYSRTLPKYSKDQPYVRPYMLAYVLGNRILDDEIQNVAMEVIFRRYEASRSRRPTFEHVKIAFEGSQK